MAQAAIGYFKGEPNDYLLIYTGERLARAGAGLAFFYWRPSTTIVSVPTSTLDTPFIFNETTGNFQSVSVQGQLTYRIADPKRMASILNFSIDPATRAWTSTDPEKLAQRLVNVAQICTKHELLQLSLEDALRQAAPLAGKVLARVTAEPALSEMGVECAGL